MQYQVVAFGDICQSIFDHITDWKMGKMVVPSYTPVGDRDMRPPSFL